MRVKYLYRVFLNLLKLYFSLVFFVADGLSVEVMVLLKCTATPRAAIY